VSRSRPKTVPRVSWGCHNHGSCDICVGNRTRWKTRMPEISEWEDGCTTEQLARDAEIEKALACYDRQVTAEARGEIYECECTERSEDK
jgi:hypothetical protein